MSPSHGKNRDLCMCRPARPPRRPFPADAYKSSCHLLSCSVDRNSKLRLCERPSPPAGLGSAQRTGSVAAGVRKDLPGETWMESCVQGQDGGRPGAPTPPPPRGVGRRAGLPAPNSRCASPRGHLLRRAQVACPGPAVRPSSAPSGFDRWPGRRAQSTRGSCVLGPALGPRDPSALFWAGRLVAGCQSRRAPSRPLLVAPSPPLSTPAYDLSPSQNFLQTVFLKTISANPTEFAQRTAPGSVRNRQHGPAMPSASSVSASVSRVACAVLLPPACDSFSPLLTVALSLPDV